MNDWNSQKEYELILSYTNQLISKFKCYYNCFEFHMMWYAKIFFDVLTSDKETADTWFKFSETNYEN